MNLSLTGLRSTLSIVGLCLLAAACAQSPRTTGESTPEGDAPAEAAAPATAAAPKEATTPPPAAPAPEPAPRWVTVSVPAGTQIEVELIDALSSGTSQVGDPVRARLTGDLSAEGRRIAPAGTGVLGTVTEVVPLKKFGGQPKISVRFDSLGIEGGDPVAIAASLSQAGKKQAGRDAAKIGGATAAGAVVGHQVDDDKGAEIGALIGGAIGTVVAAKTGKEVELSAGTMMSIVLEREVQVRLPE